MGRTPGAEEAILLASSAGEVRQYLIKRAEKASAFEPVGQEAEAQLLARDDRLIDLSLAEYCLHRETAQALFERNPDDWPIRSLVLANQALGKSEFIDGFPACLFESEEKLLAYLGAISADERSVLFSNPSLDESFLEAFLSMGKPWEAMDAQQRLWALDNLAGNAKLHKERSTRDFDEGWDWYMAGKPFEAAWSLLERLDPTPENAKHLSVLLRDLPADSFKTKEVAAALAGWRAEVDEAEEEAEENAKGRLTAFQEVRQAGARLLASNHKAKLDEFLDSDDVAIRCGGYEAAPKLSEAAIEAAIERDGELARVHLIRNERLWRSEKTRDLLLDLVLRGSKSDEPRWEYNRRERHYRKEHPHWFKDEEYEQSEPDRRPISESSIADVAAGVAGSPAIRGVQERLAVLERQQRGLLWMSTLIIIALAALLAR